VTDTNVFELSQPGSFADPLTEILRNGARALLAQAVEAEVAVLLSCHADKLTDDGRQRLVRHGHLPEREIMTGIGPVAVRCPRVRDRVGEGAERIRFSSAILPPYARRSKSLEVLIPVLYLKGVSTGDFEEALIALLGKDAGGLSASTISRLKEAWAEEHAHWSKRDLSAKRYVYFSNRPFGVKHFQTIHHCCVDVAHGLVLLFGIGTKALPSWDSKTRWNDLLVGLAARQTVGPSRHANSPHPSSREGHHATARWSSRFLLSDLILCGSHAAAACSRVQRNSVPSTHMRCMITASRRAKATIAFFIPRRLAICIAQALSQDHFFDRNML
jgi:Transposase, Mutator family